MYTYICLYNSPTHALALPFLVILQAHGAPTSAREEDALRGLGLSYIRTECYYMYSIIHNPPPRCSFDVLPHGHTAPLRKRMHYVDLNSFTTIRVITIHPDGSVWIALLPLNVYLHTY